MYSHLSNKRGGWNKREGGAKVAKSLNVEVGINVEGGKILEINKRGGWIIFCGGWNTTNSETNLDFQFAYSSLRKPYRHLKETAI